MGSRYAGLFFHGFYNDGHSNACLLYTSCSDGLHGYVSEELIRHIMESDCALQAKVDLLIQAALDAGGYDNVSIILVDKEDAADE